MPSCMCSLLISALRRFRWAGFVIPMAVRSCDTNRLIITSVEKLRIEFMKETKKKQKIIIIKKLERRIRTSRSMFPCVRYSPQGSCVILSACRIPPVWTGCSTPQSADPPARRAGPHRPVETRALTMSNNLLNYYPFYKNTSERGSTAVYVHVLNWVLN